MDIALCGQIPGYRRCRTTKDFVKLNRTLTLQWLLCKANGLTGTWPIHTWEKKKEKMRTGQLKRIIKGGQTRERPAWREKERERKRKREHLHVLPSNHWKLVILMKAKHPQRVQCIKEVGGEKSDTVSQYFLAQCYIDIAVPSVAIFIYLILWFDLCVLVHTSTLITMLLKYTRWYKTLFFFWVTADKMVRKTTSIQNVIYGRNKSQCIAELNRNTFCTITCKQSLYIVA